MRVDAHQHFWRYTAEEYGWIDEGMSAIQRDFLPSELRSELDQAGIDESIAVQARQLIEETRWLLQLADEHEWIAGVVGWVPLVDREIGKVLEPLAANPRLKGLRHVLQAEPDEYFEREDFHAGIAQLRPLSLVYDVLIVERQLPAAIRFVDRHPNQPFVLDHVAKPRIGDHELEPWRKNIRELARRPHVVCKLSGMVTEASFDHWTEADLKPYVETVLEAFGPARLLFGSDWPVCTVAASYGRWASVVDGWIAQLSVHERSAILGENAVRLYSINQSSNGHEVITF
jgi:L-fuconolactonase